MRRRNFLIAAGGGLVALIAAGSQVPIPAIPSRPEPDLDAAAGWIRYQDGRYTLLLPRMEIGQNIATTFKQIACAELGASWETVDVALPDTAEIAPVKSTVGSESVKDFALPLAQACAALRDAVAAGRADGVIAVAPRPVSDLRAFKDGAAFIGEAPPLEHARAIVTGAPLYAGDVRLDGMLYGRVLRAPAGPDQASRPRAWREAAAQADPGFAALTTGKGLDLRANEGLGVVAKTPGALDRISEALAVEWQVDQQNTEDLAAIDVDRQARQGDARYQLEDEPIDEQGAWDVDLRLDTPLGVHGAIEPRIAVAAPTPEGVKIWAGTQDAFFVRDAVAKGLGLSPDAVLVQPMRVGGGFGGKTLCSVELEAAALALAAQKPVKVQWTRAQEMQLTPHRPPSSHRIRARVKNGRIAAWDHRFVTSHILFTNAVVPPWLQTLTNLTPDKGAARGAVAPYRFGQRRLGMDLVRLPVFTGPWRGLGAGPNALAVEYAMTECAQRAGADPVAFRLAHIEDPRLAGVLRKTADMADWRGAAAERVGSVRRARGVACGIYKEMSYAAVIADVAVEADGAWRVERLFCAHDCGVVFNPDQVRAQCEGNLLWGLGLVADPGPALENGRSTAESFSDAPVPRLDAAPRMEIALIDSDAAPTGAGETAIVAAPAAILSALRAATNDRFETIPASPGGLALSEA